MDSCPVSNRDSSPLKTAKSQQHSFRQNIFNNNKNKARKTEHFSVEYLKIKTRVQSKLIALQPLHLQPLELFIQENIVVGPRVSVLGTLRLNFVWPITVTEDNQMNQSDIKARTCPRRKEREKAYQQVTHSILIG